MGFSTSYVQWRRACLLCAKKTAHLIWFVPQVRGHLSSPFAATVLSPHLTRDSWSIADYPRTPLIFSTLTVDWLTLKGTHETDEPPESNVILLRSPRWKFTCKKRKKERKICTPCTVNVDVVMRGKRKTKRIGGKWKYVQRWYLLLGESVKYKTEIGFLPFGGGGGGREGRALESKYFVCLILK